MTIEQLAEVATDEENFSHDGEVVVRLPNGDIVSVLGAVYLNESKQLVVTIESVARQEQGT